MKKKNSEQPMNAIKVKTPAFWVYTLPRVLLGWIFMLQWNVRIHKEKAVKKLKRPFLMLGNHASAVDVVVAVVGIAPHKVNVVTGKDLFTWKEFRPFIKAFGAIPKSQFAIDINSIKTMKAAVEQGRNLLLYPEGKTSLDGKSLYYINPSIAKFIKFLDVDVVVIHSSGSYLCRPRYTRGFRKGRIDANFSLLMTREEVRALSNKEIYDKVINSIAFNDHIWQQQNHIRVKSPVPAYNLNYLLYKCPKCGAEYETESDGKILSCKACGNSVEYTEYGELLPIGDSKTFERIDLWYDYERECCIEELKKDDFYFEKPVTFYMENKETAKYEVRGKGVYYLDKEKIGYKGTLDGQPFEYSDNLRNYSAIVTKTKEGVDHIVNDVTYRFMFDEQKWSSKVNLLVEANFIMNNPKIFEK